jgi:hypothetical protein
MTAAVMPTQHALWEAACGEEAEHTFDVADLRGVFIFVASVRNIRGQLRKEARRASCCSSPPTITCLQRAIRFYI